MKHTTLSLFLSIILATCSSSPLALKDYPEVAHFSAGEQEDLARIIAFMDKSVCLSEQLNDSAISKCYENFLQSLTEGATAGEVIIPFSEEERTELFGQLKPETVRAIWTETPVDRQNTILQVNPQAKFGTFLEKYAVENATARTYDELLRSTGYVSASRFIDHIMQPGEQGLEIDDERLRFLIAVQFLAISTQ